MPELGATKNDEVRQDVRVAIDDRIAPAVAVMEHALADDRFQHARQYAQQIEAAAHGCWS